MYTFRKLAGQVKDKAGYLKTYFRTQSAANTLTNFEVLNVDYSKDFKGYLDQDDPMFYLSYIKMRFEHIFQTAFDLFVLHIGIYLIS